MITTAVLYACDDGGSGGRDIIETPPDTVFTVTYNAGIGNTGGIVPLDSNEYDEANHLVVVQDNTGGLTGEVIRDGIRQRFVEWNTQANGGGLTRLAGSTFTITEDTILYAIYTTGAGVMRKLGPAGGWVFYDAGSVQSWGRYLEAANEDMPSGVWGAEDNAVPGAHGEEIGTGAQNTEAIALGDAATADKAADRCLVYSVVYEGVTYDNWFLPSRDELDAMYSNLHSVGAGFFEDAYYWSSTESNEYMALGTHFNDGGRLNASKASIFRSRPVRAF